MLAALAAASVLAVISAFNRAVEPGLANRTRLIGTIIRAEITALSADLGFDLAALELPLGADGQPRVEDIAPKMVELKAAGGGGENPRRRVLSRADSTGSG